jgi:V/A-type H+/Na+-transporting ATPase subunit C
MKYVFFVAWLRAKEKKLTDRIDLDRMIGASTLEDAFKVLNDTNYSPYISNKKHSDLEEIIKEERKGFKKDLSIMGLDKKALDFLFLEDQISFLRKEIKENYFEKDSKKRLFEKNKEIMEEIEKAKPEKLSDIDSVLSEILFKKMIDFCVETKEKEVTCLLKRYWQEMETNENIEQRENKLVEIEDRIVEQGRDSTSGIMPILSFLIKRKRAENHIRNIFAGKRLNFPDIDKLIIPARTL